MASTPVRFTAGRRAEWLTLKVLPVGVVTDWMTGLTVELVSGATSIPSRNGLLPGSVNRRVEVERDRDLAIRLGDRAPG